MKNWFKIFIVCFLLVGVGFAFKALTKGPEGTNGTYSLPYDVNAWTLRSKWMNIGSINDSMVVRSSNTYFRKIAPLSETLNGYAQKNGTAFQYIKGDGTFATFPSIPSAQVQSDWIAVSGLGVILNKPTIPTNTNQLTNGSGFITSVPAQSWTSITGKPTTISGYGITDAYPLTGNPNGFLTSISNAQVLAVLGFTPYNSTNPNSFISRTGLSASNGVAYNSTTGNITLTKRQETYTGTTAGSGTYTVTYGTAYSVEPNVIISQRGGTPTNTLVLTSSSTTGFTVTANNRVEVLGLLPTYPTLNGAVVNVTVTEK